jgi:hypothetical protein
MPRREGETWTMAGKGDKLQTIAAVGTLLVEPEMQ